MFLTRRQFLKTSAGTIAALAIADKAFALTALQPVIEVGNPLGEYPDRSWERVYHDQYRYDSSFSYICSPNDTHACRVRAFVRNGVVMRIEQNYDHQTYEDLYGNRGTFAWNPRMCLKGYTFHRRVYGPYRLKGPMLRKGWKQWVDDGCPELSPEVKTRYKFSSRGEDDMLRVSWDTAATYLAKGQMKIAERYSGEAGARRLREELSRLRHRRGRRGRVRRGDDPGVAPRLLRLPQGCARLLLKGRIPRGISSRRQPIIGVAPASRPLSFRERAVPEHRSGAWACAVPGQEVRRGPWNTTCRCSGHHLRRGLSYSR